jgi:DNA-binding HxlR family transcriptional regulator
VPLRSDWSSDRCPIARSLDVVGDPWVLLILRQAFSGVRRYEDFRVEVGAADNVLSRRLRGLVDAGLLDRSPYADGARTRYEYVLTEAGADLLPLLNQLTLWGEKHRPHSEHMWVVHIGCGAVSESAERCSACGEPLTPEQVSWRKTWRDDDVRLVGVPPAG